MCGEKCTGSPPFKSRDGIIYRLNQTNGSRPYDRFPPEFHNSLTSISRRFLPLRNITALLTAAPAGTGKNGRRKFRVYLIGLALLLTLAAVIYRFYFAHYTVTTWEDWCTRVSGADLAKRRSAAAISYNYQAIKDDFVREFGAAYVKAAAGGELNKSPADGEVQELVRKKKLGVWYEGAHLHVANCFVGVPGNPGSVPFQKYYESWQLYTNLKTLDGLRHNLTSRDYCTDVSMNDFFVDVTLHCNVETATLPLAYRQRPGAAE